MSKSHGRVSQVITFQQFALSARKYDRNARSFNISWLCVFIFFFYDINLARWKSFEQFIQFLNLTCDRVLTSYQFSFYISKQIRSFPPLDIFFFLNSVHYRFTIQ